MDESIDLMSFLSPEARVALVQGLSFGAKGPHWSQVFQPSSPGRSPRLPSDGDQFDHWLHNNDSDDDSDKDYRLDQSTGLYQSDYRSLSVRHLDKTRHPGETCYKSPLENTCTGDVIWEWPKYIDVTLKNFTFQNLINLHFACDSYIWMMSPANQTPGSEPGGNTRSLLRRLIKLGATYPVEVPPFNRNSTNERKRSKRRNPKGLSKTK